MPGSVQLMLKDIVRALVILLIVQIEALIL